MIWHYEYNRYGKIVNGTLKLTKEMPRGHIAYGAIQATTLHAIWPRRTWFQMRRAKLRREEATEQL